MKNIWREFTIKMELDCFNTIFDYINASVFVTVKKATHGLPQLRNMLIEDIIIKKIEDEYK
jgi:excinuclease UvrABC helicase subunit UvrB